MNSPHQGSPRRDRSFLDQALFAELCLLPPATWPVEPDLPAEPVDAVWPVGGNLFDVLRPLTRRRVPALPPAPVAPAAVVVAEPPPRAAIDGPFAGETVQVCLPPLDALLGPPAAAPPTVDTAALVMAAPPNDKEDPQTPLPIPAPIEPAAPPPAPPESVVEPIEPPPPEPAPEPLPVVPRPPLRLAALAPLQVRRGATESLTAGHLRVDGAESAFLVDLVLVDPPACGTLLRDGFALNAGDVFTQEDVDHGRLCYRHDGATGSTDQFTFMTTEGDVPATAFAIEVTHAVRAPDLLGPGAVGDLRDGCRVRDLLAGVVRLDNPDDEPGLAVVAAAGGGAWQVADDEAEWRDLVDVRHSAAALLGPDERVRFVPRPGWSGTARLTYRAWDRRDGEPGRRVNLAPRHATGGSTAFSRQVETVVVTVAPPAERQARREVLPWAAEPTVHDLFGGPVAVVRLDGEGVWQYSLESGPWADFGAVYHGRARLLGGGDRVRFLPRPGGGGRVVLAARPWTADEVAAGATVDLAAHRATGAGTAFGEAVHTRTWRLTG